MNQNSTLTAPAPPSSDSTSNHSVIIEFVSSLTANRVIRITESGGSAKVIQVLKYETETQRLHFIDLGRALRENKIPSANSIAVRRIAKANRI